MAFYYRIFAIPRFRSLLIWVAFVCMVYLVGIDLTILFQWYSNSLLKPSVGAEFRSRPLHYAWDRVDEKENGHCFNVDGFFIGSGSVNVFLNFLIFILVSHYQTIIRSPGLLTMSKPIPLLWRLRTTTRQQIILSAIFTLAGL